MLLIFRILAILNWIVLINKPFQIQIRVWGWLFESLYKRTRREISLWQTWLWILWYSNATCCQNRGSQISITLQGKKKLYDSYHILIKFGFFLTEAGAYPQLPTQPNFFWSFSNLCSNLIWSFWVASRRKIKIWIWGKKVRFITEKGGLWAFLAWKRNFQ